MTHQDIIDRMEALGKEHTAAYKAEVARIDKEKESLQELCGAISEGHFFAKRNSLMWPSGFRYCCFCGAGEPRPSAASWAESIANGTAKRIPGYERVEPKA